MRLRPVGIDAAELPDLGEVAEEPSLPPAAATTEVTPLTTGLAAAAGRADRRYDPARCDTGTPPATGTLPTAIGTPSANGAPPATNAVPAAPESAAVHAALRRPTSRARAFGLR